MPRSSSSEAENIRTTFKVLRYLIAVVIMISTTLTFVAGKAAANVPPSPAKLATRDTYCPNIDSGTISCALSYNFPANGKRDTPATLTPRTYNQDIMLAMFCNDQNAADVPGSDDVSDEVGDGTGLYMTYDRNCTVSAEKCNAAYERILTECDVNAELANGTWDVPAGEYVGDGYAFELYVWKL